MKIFFLINLKAGKEKIKAKLSDIIDLYCRKGHEVTIYSTQKAGDARNQVKRMNSSYDRVICAGGDGTLDEVVSGMMQREKKLPIGYIPAGSTNDFAVSCKIPTDIMEAAMTSISDYKYLCDIGRFNQTYFVYIAAFGLFTDVSYETSQEMKNALGHMAYVLEGMKRIPVMRTFHMKVESTECSIEDDFIYGMVTNSDSVGGFKNLTGDCVDLGDGLFEVTLIKKPENPVELSAIIAKLMDHQTDTNGVCYFKSAQITFTSSEAITWTLDGEKGDSVNNVTISNMKRSIEIVTKLDH